MKMASPQADIFITGGKAYLSLDHVNTVLASQPDNPSRLIVAFPTGPDGRIQYLLQVRRIDNASTGDQTILGQYGPGPYGHQRVAGSVRGVKPDNKYYQDESRLLKQLQHLQIQHGDTLEQLLTVAHPRVFSHLEKACGTLVRLATAHDGRVFSVMIGSTAESQWMGNYPGDYLEARITPYQANVLEGILLAAKDDPPLACVLASIAALKPEALQQYHQQIERPIDINFIMDQIDNNDSYTIAQFMTDLQLLRVKTSNFFGPNHEVTYLISSAVTSMLERMNIFSAEEISPEATDTLESLIWKGRRIAVGGIACSPVRGMVYRHGMPWGDDRPPAGASQFPHLVVQLGRLCVARSPDATVYATRHMVVMDISSPHKALWVFWYYFKDTHDTGGYPLLPSDQEALLGGQCIRFSFRRAAARKDGSFALRSFTIPEDVADGDTDQAMRK